MIKESLPYLLIKDGGKERVFYNYSDSEGKVVNDYNDRGIMIFKYDEANQLVNITFLNKDSVVDKIARQEFTYNDLGRMVSKRFVSREGATMFSPTEYKYDEQGLMIEAIIPGKNRRIGLGSPGRVKFFYNNDLLEKVAYFTSKGEPAIRDEMGVSYISFEYNSDRQLVSEVLHYTGTTDADDPPYMEWLHEYNYDKNGALISIKYKFNRASEAYDGEEKFVYDRQNQLYGYGDPERTIIPMIPYDEISLIVYQHLYTDFYYPHQKLPAFRN